MSEVGARCVAHTKEVHMGPKRKMIRKTTTTTEEIWVDDNEGLKGIDDDDSEELDEDIEDEGLDPDAS